MCVCMCLCLLFRGFHSSSLALRLSLFCMRVNILLTPVRHFRLSTQPCSFRLRLFCIFNENVQCSFFMLKMNFSLAFFHTSFSYNRFAFVELFSLFKPGSEMYDSKWVKNKKLIDGSIFMCINDAKHWVVIWPEAKCFHNILAGERFQSIMPMEFMHGFSLIWIDRRNWNKK